MQVKAYAVTSPQARPAPSVIERREPGDRDIVIEIAYCGICHSDIHQARDEWGGSIYPMVPGHEIAGRVVKTGRRVKKFKVGDLAGIGCFVDSCRACSECKQGTEQFCANGASFTYNSLEQDKKTPTYGGYSSHITVADGYALKAPPKIALERVAPLLCAGITTYAPLKRYGPLKAKTVGVLGLGGLGHMAVKIAAAMGAEVTVLSASAAKRASAQSLGAADFILTTDASSDAKLSRRFDLVIDTVSAVHDTGKALGWLKTRGTLVLVGLPPKPFAVNPFDLLIGQRTVAGSVIGGIAETQEMLDFCASKGIGADVEVIAASEIGRAYERILTGDVRYRFSIDLKTLG